MVVDRPGAACVSVWAGNTGPAALLRLGPRDGPGPGDSLRLGFEPRAVLLLADADSAGELRWPAAPDAGVPVVGARLGLGPGAGRTVMLAGPDCHRDGAVGVVFGPGADVRPLHASGWHPVGPVLGVTRAEGDLIYQLDDQAALDRLTRVVRDEVPAGDLPPGRLRIALGPLASASVPPQPVRGVDRASGALALRGPVPSGESVCVHVLDASWAATALREQLAEPLAAALVLSPGGASAACLPDAIADLAGEAVAIGGLEGLGVFTSLEEAASPHASGYVGLCFGG